MNNSLFNFKDDEEREMFFVAIPVIALFALLGYWLMQSDTPEVSTQSIAVAIADTDGDGVTDAVDQCVSTAGDVANYGCSVKVAWADRDNDADGLRNEIDSCPETKGTIANNGCAVRYQNPVQAVALAPIVEPLDTDGDGIPDNTDACVSLAATTDDGCPTDRDSDGVIDTEDQCPNTAGSAVANGCLPDADNDGVLGDADQCPDQAGTAASNGCPVDTDGDGVIDTNDNCPAVAGSQNDGCPTDTDGDGVADDDDSCPSEAGLEANQGCAAVADADADGVSDADDRCPQLAGPENNEGCPLDTDADGVTDSEDQCPNIAGTVNGCPPDSDDDGVADADDNCPGIAGVAQNFGCPADNDGDGIADIDDNCPDVAGTDSFGCPVAAPDEVKRVLDAAISGVKFNSSSSILTSRSRDILELVAKLMKDQPNSVLEISGHTDSSGDQDRNLQLSMDRARACATFIASQGISTDRLQAYGYGDTQPLVDNSTLAGRERNRRVEFVLK